MSSWLTGILSKLFVGDSDPAAGGRALDRELALLERQARRALPGSAGHFLNRAGDLCSGAKQHDRALHYYGRAIDASLEAGRIDAAGAVCRKVVRLSPTVVRARCTLAWISIGKGLSHDAQRDLRDYVAAAQRAGQERVARQQLLLMADSVQDGRVRELLASFLTELGDEKAAGRVVARAKADREAVEDAYPDPEERWARVIRAALMGPDEVLRGPQRPGGE